MFYRSLTLILVALLICGLFFVRVNADDPSVNYHKPDLNYAAILLNNKEIALLDQWRSLDKLEIQQAMLRVRWDDNTEDMVESAISLGNAVTVDVLQIVASLISTTANSIKDYADHVALAVARAEKNFEISSQNISTQVAVVARDEAYKHYKLHYDAYVANYSGSLTLISKGRTPSSLSADALSVPCGNLKCSTTYSSGTYGLSMVVWYAQNFHKMRCDIPHYQRGLLIPPNPTIYWDCPNDPRSECPHEFFHKIQCGGGCGTWFKNEPNKIRSHWVNCNETVRGTLENFWDTNCRGYYYSCNGDTSTDCWNVDNHISGGSTPPTGSTPPPPDPPTDNTPNCQDCTSDCSSPCSCTNSGTCGGTVSTPPSGSTPPSPSYHACNVHETSVSGDHSYISSCSSSNANGTCQNSSGYYACSPHSHSYPSPSSPPANPPSGSTPPSNPPSPPEPTLVRCGAASWTGCSGAPSQNAHKVESCTNCSGLYWTCGDASWHEDPITCVRPGCGVTYTGCTNDSGDCLHPNYLWHKSP